MPYRIMSDSKGGCMNQQQNAWIAAVTPVKAPAEAEAAPVSLPPLTGAALPQKGISEPDATDRLPRRQVSGSAVLWVVGAHGGAGESTLSRLIEGSRPTQHSWPVTEDAENHPRVLLVCRSSVHGLQAAQRALIEWTSPRAPQMQLLGLAVLADAPGRLPKPLRDLTTIVGGGAPRLWHLPWVEAWRTNDLELRQLPRETRKFITEVHSLLL